jgi:OOP family OmpA-OmpF porin
MRPLKSLILGSAAALVLATPAFAGEGWYLGLGAGWDNLQPINAGGPGIADGKFHFKDSWRGTASAGYKWDDGLRFEVQAGYTPIKPKSYTFNAGGTIPKSGTLDSFSVGAGLMYDAPLSDRWLLTLGGGVGVAFANSSGPKLVGHNTVFGAQGTVGIVYEASDNLDLQLDYTYAYASRTHFHDATIPPPNGITFGIATANNVMVSFRYFLGHEEPPPPPPPPPAPPPPPPPPAVKTFIVFFDFDKSNLTAEAQQVVSDAVRAAHDNGWVKVMVTGHTDTVGSDAYNQALSERRANSVKDEMVREGMSDADISVQGKSFHDPLVPTGPGVREPQNRRAVIEF